MDIEQDETGTPRKTGDEWLLKGALTYIPLPEVVCVCVCVCVYVPVLLVYIFPSFILGNHQ